MKKRTTKKATPKAVRPGIIGARVREFCKAKGWSLQELGERAGKHTPDKRSVSVTQISRIVNEARDVRVATLGHIAAALELSDAQLGSIVRREGHDE